MERIPGPKNMARWFNYLTFDVMGELLPNFGLAEWIAFGRVLTLPRLGELCFGRAFNMLQRETTRFVARLIDMAAWRHYICGNYPLLDVLHIDKILFPTISAERW